MGSEYFEMEVGRAGGGRASGVPILDERMTITTDTERAHLERAIELAESGPIIVKREGGFGGRVPSDWRERFIRAYDIEFQEWIDAATAGRSTGPSSWDGYAATVVCDTGLAALHSGARESVSLREKPDLYK